MPAPRHQALSPGEGSILILGAGAMGRLWAASLPTDTTRLLARPGQPTDTDTFRFQPVDGPEQLRTVSVRPAAEASQAELLLVTTKAHQTLDALAEQLPLLPPTLPIVLFQNGLGSQQAVAETWPAHPVLAAVTTEGANRPEPDLTVHAGLGQTWIGAINPAGQRHLDAITQRLAHSPLRVQPEADIQSRLWRKLVVNAGINPFTALLDCRNGDILAQPLYQHHIDGLCQELSALMAAEGLATDPPAHLRATIEQVARATARNISSMRADVMQGRRTEIDYINGYVTRRSRALGLPCPVNAMLTEKVRNLANG